MYLNLFNPTKKKEKSNVRIFVRSILVINTCDKKGRMSCQVSNTAAKILIYRLYIAPFEIFSQGQATLQARTSLFQVPNYAAR